MLRALVAFTVTAALSATAATSPGVLMTTTLAASAVATTYLFDPIVMMSPARMVPVPVSSVSDVDPMAYPEALLIR